MSVYENENIKLNIKLNPTTILYLMDCAEVSGFSIHKLCDLIRKGASEQECLKHLNRCLQASYNQEPTF